MLIFWPFNIKVMRAMKTRVRGLEVPLIVRNGLPFYSTDSSYDYDIYGLTITYDLGFAT